MTALDLTWLLIILLTAALVGSLYYVRTERQRAHAQQTRAEELSCWADAYQRDLATVQQENKHPRERNAHLQELHAERTRQLLAKNYTIIDSTIQWRRTGNR